MGLFDDVYFHCPECGEIVETQSKAGECSLSTYWEDSVPVEIGVDLEGEHVYCAGCFNSFIIETEEPIARVRLKLRERE